MRTQNDHDIRRWLAGVGKIAAAVNARTTLPHLLDLIASTACDLTGYEASGVLLSDDDRRKLVISGVHGLSPDYVAAVNDRHTIALGSGPLADGPSSRAFVTQQPVPISDIQSDPSFEPWAHEATRHGYRAIVAIPMLVRGEAVGTLNCYRRVVHEFGSDELALLATLANQAASALQSTRCFIIRSEFRGVQTRVGELVCLRNLFWTCVEQGVAVATGADAQLPEHHGTRRDPGVLHLRLRARRQYSR